MGQLKDPVLREKYNRKELITKIGEFKEI